jgi:teichuronic acid biosynthesis glycosyltransferase TuaH
VPDGWVVYGTTPWDDAWLTEHNLAHALAERHRVLYVEPPVTPLSPLRRRDRAEVRALLRRGARQSGRVHVFRPFALPPREHPRAKRLSAPLVRMQLRRVASQLGLREPTVLAARNTAELTGAVGERTRVYLVKDLVEAGGELLGLESGRLAGDVAAMCAGAQVVCATSEALRASLAERGVDSALLPHGFHADLAPLYDSAERPHEYASLPGRLLGYTGRIDSRLDFELIRAVADSLPAASVVLIGPVSPRLPREDLALLRSRSNIHLLGARPRRELPAYLAHLDCCLMPYRDSEWIRHASPLKVWDFLYAGPPIVGAGCPALRDFPPPLVAFAEDAPAFLDAVRSALDSPGDGRERRREHALANSWDERARELERLAAGAATEARRAPVRSDHMGSPA